MKNFKNFKLKNNQLKNLNGGNGTTIPVTPPVVPVSGIVQAQDFNTCRGNREKGTNSN